MPDIRPLILSGGSGTRLWPLSTGALPKQFADLLGGGSLFERTLGRLPSASPPIIVAGVSHLALVTDACRRAGVDPHLIVVEPAGRNTAPACIAGALLADADEVLVVLPSDHLIADVEAFRERVSEAAKHAERGSIVVFGVSPDRPETGFGYVRAGEERDGAWDVAEFVEKPDLDSAREMVEDGRHLWNSGMFVLTAGTLLAEARRSAPTLVAGIESSLGEPERDLVTLGEDFAAVESISFDHAIMERTERGVVIPLHAGWDDIGSFQALWEASERDASGNAVEGEVMLRDVSGSLIKATSRTVAAAGLEDVVIVETPEVVLVVPRDRAQLVRDLAAGHGAAAPPSPPA